MSDKPEYGDMIPWHGGECPWEGDVYFTMTGDSKILGKTLGSNLFWEEDDDISGYMPVDLWERGYRAPSAGETIDANTNIIFFIDGKLISGKFGQYNTGALVLYKKYHSCREPDDLMEHCDKNQQKLMEENSLGGWEEAPLEDLLEELTLYNRALRNYGELAEKSREGLASVLSKINSLLPEGYEVVSNDIDKNTSDEVNDWEDWEVGDVLKCVKSYSGGFSENLFYEILDKDNDDPECPILLEEDNGHTYWPVLGLRASFVKSSS